MTNKTMTMKTLDEYLGFQDALAYLNEIGHSVSEGTFKKHNYPSVRSRYIQPIPVGVGVHRQTGETAAFSVVFTKRMLRRYAAGDQVVEPTEAELDSIVTLREVAAALDRPYKAVKYLVTSKKLVPSKTIGRISIVLRRDIDKLAERAGLRPAQQQGV